jgi:SAM-dependent methyltransferase
MSRLNRTWAKEDTATNRMRKRIGSGTILAPALLLTACCNVLLPQMRPLQWTDIDTRLAAQEGYREETFDARIGALNQETARRMAEGERDHLIYYILQSTRFTSVAPVEPAVSALDEQVLKRINDFLATKLTGPRIDSLRRPLPATGRHEFLEAEYRRAMKFLHEKETPSISKQGEARRTYIASLYQRRGHSTDTQLEANFAVHAGLAFIRELDPAFSARRVLIIGPGIDFSPRTALREEAEPQSYQPYAVADSLVKLGFASLAELEIHGADINPRVVEFLNRRPRTLSFCWNPGELDHEAYFSNLGSSIGTLSPIKQRCRTLALNGADIRGLPWNILTERPAQTALYDIVISTNVLLYFSRPELLLALNNIRALLRPGGYFLHNDLRLEIEEFSRLLAMPPVHARMIRMPGKELYDSVVIHRAN